MLITKGISCLLLLITAAVFIFSVKDSRGQDSSSISFDPDDPPDTTIQIAPYLTFGAQVDLEYIFFRNLDLDNTKDNDFSVIEPGLTVAFSFDPNRHIQAFLETRLGRNVTFSKGDRSGDNVSLEIEQAYMLFKNFFNDSLSFQIGRQRFEDEREWLYDEELDAIRLIYEISDYSFELSASRLNLVDRDLFNSDQKERIYNYGFYGKYQKEVNDKETNLGAYVLFRDDRSTENESPAFAGVHADGDLTHSFAYWLDAAYVFGEQGANNIRAFGFDIGAIYQFDLPTEPSVTLGYAFGTGDGNLDDKKDTNFRQSGFHNNESSFNGVADFKYYGEVFDSELSNLSVFSAGAGINPTEESSIDFVYHYYLQHKASDIIRDSVVNAVPSGLSKRLGTEVDLILGYERNSKLDMALKLGYFLPGKTFTSNSENIFLLKFEIQYEF
jgi:alginate production protein